MRSRNQQFKGCFLHGVAENNWLHGGYQLRCAAVYLLTVHCIDTSSDANVYVHVRTSSSETSISISLSVPRKVC